jgi:hypothetical protein
MTRMVLPDTKSLLPFVRRLCDPTFAPGKWDYGADRDKEYEPPFYVMSKATADFVTAAYAGGWVRPDINWSGKAEQGLFVRLCSTPDAIETANVEELALVLTTLIRGERFTEGTLAKAIEDGVIQRVLARVSELANASSETSSLRSATGSIGVPSPLDHDL